MELYFLMEGKTVINAFESGIFPKIKQEKDSKVF